MNKSKYPEIVAATIAGVGIGSVTNAMIKGERSEQEGDSDMKQIGNFALGGLSGGIIGGGIGLGVGGTAHALKQILRK